MTPPPLSKATTKSFVYLLKSLKDKKFYLGWTTNLSRRLDAHNMGRVYATKARAPFELVHFEIYLDKNMAKLRERQLKHRPRSYSLFKKRAMLCASCPTTKEVVG